MESRFSEYRMGNLERGLKILEQLAGHPEGLGTSELARALDLPKNFVFRAAKVLEGYDFISRDQKAKTYTLSPKMLSMSYSSLQQNSLMEVALPLMRELRDRVEETVVLCLIRDGHGLVLDSVPGTHAFRFVVESGMTFEVHASAPGKAVLAFLPEEEATRQVEMLSFTRFNDRTITSAQAFHQELARVRERGYALDRAEQLDGVHCVAAPIRDRFGNPVAAINTTGPSNRLRRADFDRVGELMRGTADRISKQLGYMAAEGDGA